MEKSLPENVFQLPFDQYQRYRCLSESLEVFREKDKPLTILDIGGYLRGSDQEGFTPSELFFPDDNVIVVDVKFSGPGRYLVASGFALPIRDAGVDVAVSMDTLEHIPPRNRKDFIHEMCRIARLGIVLICPVFEPRTVLAEKILNNFIQRIFHQRHPALAEHIDYGLPETGQILTWLKNEAMHGVDFGDGFLPNWLFMMIMKHFMMNVPGAESEHRLLDHFYNLTMGGSDRREPAYRHVFVFAKKQVEADFNRLNKESPSAEVSELYGIQLADLLLMLETARINLNMEDFFTRNPSWMTLRDLAEERYAIILQKEDIIQRQLNLIADKEKYIAKLESGVLEVQERADEFRRKLDELKAQHAKQIQAKDSEILELAGFKSRVQQSLLYRIYRRVRYGNKV